MNVTLSAFDYGMMDQQETYLLPPMSISRLQTGPEQFAKNNPAAWQSGGQNILETSYSRDANQCLSVEIQLSKSKNFAFRKTAHLKGKAAGFPANPKNARAVLDGKNEDIKWTVNPDIKITHNASQSCEF